jgi:hypothetical protein
LPVGTGEMGPEWKILLAEETGAQFAVGSQAQSVAVGAEVL